MDESNKPYVDQSEYLIPIGMSIFVQNEREQVAQKVRLAIACIEGAPEPVKDQAIPLDESTFASD